MPRSGYCYFLGFSISPPGCGRDLKRPYGKAAAIRLPLVAAKSPPHPSRPAAVPPLAHVAASGSQARWAMATGPLPGCALASSAIGGASGTAPQGGRRVLFCFGWTSPPHPSASPTPSPQGEGCKKDRDENAVQWPPVFFMIHSSIFSLHDKAKNAPGAGLGQSRGRFIMLLSD